MALQDATTLANEARLAAVSQLETLKTQVWGRRGAGVGRCGVEVLGGTELEG